MSTHVSKANKCEICAKFASWDDLDFVTRYTMDLHGNVTQLDSVRHCGTCPTRQSQSARGDDIGDDEVTA